MNTFCSSTCHTMSKYLSTCKWWTIYGFCWGCIVAPHLWLPWQQIQPEAVPKLLMCIFVLSCAVCLECCESPQDSSSGMCQPSHHWYCHRITMHFWIKIASRQSSLTVQLPRNLVLVKRAPSSIIVDCDNSVPTAFFQFLLQQGHIILMQQKLEFFSSIGHHPHSQFHSEKIAWQGFVFSMEGMWKFKIQCRSCFDHECKETVI